MKTLTAAGILGISNLGLGIPAIDAIKYAEKSANSVGDVVVILAGHLIESDEMQQSFVEEVESWVYESDIITLASFKVFESYNVTI